MKVLFVLLFSIIEVSLALYSNTDDVIQLTSSNFDPRVLQSNEIWIIEFYAPWCGHCKSLAPEWKKAASALKGIVNIGAVDMTEHQSVGAPYGIQGFPTIKIFGSNKQKPSDYQGARTASAIVDSALSQVKSLVNDRLSGKTGGSGGGAGGGHHSDSGNQKTGNQKDVVELTDSNFEELVIRSKDMWLVEFFAPWCGHCKNLAPEWASAATQLKGKVKLGAVDATIHSIIANKYGVRGYPTIKMFPSEDKDNAVEFDGGRSASDIVTWALDKLSENVPAPEVLQLVNESILKEACLDHQLCIVSVLPHILDCQSKCRNDYISILKKLSEKHKKRMWGWLWLEAGSQHDLEDSLRIGGFGYPAMTAINSRKMKFSWLRGSFSEKGINEFLLEVAVGRSATEPIKNETLPKVVDSSAWDGKDGELPIEEEIDLSDVDLDSDTKTEL